MLNQGETALQAALTSGEWYIDNNQSTEQLSLAQRISTTANTSTHNATGGTGNSSVEGPMDVDSQDLPAYSNNSPKLVPIKSFQNELLNLSVSLICGVTAHLISFYVSMILCVVLSRLLC